MDPTETERYLCVSCMREFKVTLEPYTQCAEPADVVCCPFCRSDDLTKLEGGE